MEELCGYGPTIEDALKDGGHIEPSPPAAVPFSQPASPQGEDGERGGGSPEPQCGYCGGEGVVDSGGFPPWGEGINVPCGCLKQKPPPQDPVEWVEDISFWLIDPINGDLTKNRVTHYDDVLTLAHRCREAEQEASNPVDPEPIRKMMEALAQANTNADKWRTKALMWRRYLRQANKGAANNARALQLMAHTSGHHWQTIQELRAQLAAAQARVAELEGTGPKPIFGPDAGRPDECKHGTPISRSCIMCEGGF